MEFLGQGSDPSCSCDLPSSCINAGSFNPLCWLGSEPASYCCRDATDPTEPQRKLRIFILGLNCRPFQQGGGVSLGRTVRRARAISELYYSGSEALYPSMKNLWLSVNGVKKKKKSPQSCWEYQAASPNKIWGSSHCGSEVMNLTIICEDGGLIPDLAQWVKDLVLPWAVA